eukprot:Phypoly_transcript_07744.p1 GENE.Phypoly_transcript_07744~~Phypoly_transcript_07744.p1  ORF type:complete len:417 (-),score=58.97 Phypoly_transcript_07744:350-1567(-)
MAQYDYIDGNGEVATGVIGSYELEDGETYENVKFPLETTEKQEEEDGNDFGDGNAHEGEAPARSPILGYDSDEISIQITAPEEIVVYSSTDASTVERPRRTSFNGRNSQERSASPTYRENNPQDQARRRSSASDSHPVPHPSPPARPSPPPRTSPRVPPRPSTPSMTDSASIIIEESGDADPCAIDVVLTTTSVTNPRLVGPKRPVLKGRKPPTRGAPIAHKLTTKTDTDNAHVPAIQISLSQQTTTNPSASASAPNLSIPHTGSPKLAPVPKPGASFGPGMPNFAAQALNVQLKRTAPVKKPQLELSASEPISKHAAPPVPPRNTRTTRSHTIGDMPPEIKEEGKEGYLHKRGGIFKGWVPFAAVWVLVINLINHCSRRNDGLFLRMASSTTIALKRQTYHLRE